MYCIPVLYVREGRDHTVPNCIFNKKNLTNISYFPQVVRSEFNSLPQSISKTFARELNTIEAHFNDLFRSAMYGIFSPAHGKINITEDSKECN